MSVSPKHTKDVVRAHQGPCLLFTVPQDCSEKTISTFHFCGENPPLVVVESSAPNGQWMARNKRDGRGREKRKHNAQSSPPWCHQHHSRQENTSLGVHRRLSMQERSEALGRNSETAWQRQEKEVQMLSNFPPWCRSRRYTSRTCSRRQNCQASTSTATRGNWA